MVVRLILSSLLAFVAMPLWATEPQSANGGDFDIRFPNPPACEDLTAEELGQLHNMLAISAQKFEGLSLLNALGLASQYELDKAKTELDLGAALIAETTANDGLTWRKPFYFNDQCPAIYLWTMESETSSFSGLEN